MIVLMERVNTRLSSHVSWGVPQLGARVNTCRPIIDDGATREHVSGGRPTVHDHVCSATSHELKAICDLATASLVLQCIEPVRHIESGLPVRTYATPMRDVELEVIWPNPSRKPK